MSFVLIFQMDVVHGINIAFLYRAITICRKIYSLFSLPHTIKYGGGGYPFTVVVDKPDQSEIYLVIKTDLDVNSLISYFLVEAVQKIR